MKTKVLMLTEIPIDVKKIHPDAVVPTYAKEGDAGFDLYYAYEDTILFPDAKDVFGTGWKMAIPEGWEIQIRPRSGLSIKTDLSIVNSPGTIDSGYRGEIGIIIKNIGEKEYKIKKGDRIAQGVLKRAPQGIFNVVNELPDSERGEGGFGSSGK